MNWGKVEIKIKTMSSISVMYLWYKMILINIVYHKTKANKYIEMKEDEFLDQ
jgi:hypothetical protein